MSVTDRRLPRSGLLHGAGLRNLEALAILARAQLVGLLVVLHRLALAVELDLVADAERDVREVRQRGRQVPFEDVAGEDLRIARADRRDEVAVVPALLGGQPGRRRARI